VQGSGQTLLAFRLGLGDLVVVDGGSPGRPGGAENAVLLAVQQTEVGRGRVGGEEEDGFLDDGKILDGDDAEEGERTLKAFSAVSQRPKQVLLPPVTKMYQSCASEVGSRMDCQLLRVTGVTRFSETFSANFTMGSAGTAVGTMALALLNHP
jgi:hypothetical protein